MKTQLTEEQMLELAEEARRLKKTLKNLSKNQLIALVIQQVNIAVEQQNINKILLEKMRKTEGEQKSE